MKNVSSSSSPSRRGTSIFARQLGVDHDREHVVAGRRALRAISLRPYQRAPRPRRASARSIRRDRGPSSRRSRSSTRTSGMRSSCGSPSRIRVRLKRKLCRTSTRKSQRPRRERVEDAPRALAQLGLGLAIVGGVKPLFTTRRSAVWRGGSISEHHARPDARGMSSSVVPPPRARRRPRRRSSRDRAARRASPRSARSPRTSPPGPSRAADDQDRRVLAQEAEVSVGEALGEAIEIDEIDVGCRHPGTDPTPVRDVVAFETAAGHALVSGAKEHACLAPGHVGNSQNVRARARGGVRRGLRPRSSGTIGAATRGRASILPQRGDRAAVVPGSDRARESQHLDRESRPDRIRRAPSRTVYIAS